MLKPKMFTAEITLRASKYRRVASKVRVAKLKIASIRRHEASPAASDRAVSMEAAQCSVPLTKLKVPVIIGEVHSSVVISSLALVPGNLIPGITGQ